MGRHRIERYELKERGRLGRGGSAAVRARRRGFPPRRHAVAPDGSLFVSDWVKRDYNLHGKGAGGMCE